MNQSEEQFNNEQKLEEILTKLAPHLWKIHKSLGDTRINPIVIPYIIEAIYQVAYISRHGEVTIYIEDGKIMGINPKSRMKLKLEALVEEITEV